MTGKKAKTAKQAKPAKPKPPKKRRGARPGRGTLVLIAGLLVGSAILRLGIDAGQALAKQSEPAAEVP